jgi:hypothetical protein
VKFYSSFIEDGHDLEAGADEVSFVPLRVNFVRLADLGSYINCTQLLSFMRKLSHVNAH